MDDETQRVYAEARIAAARKAWARRPAGRNHQRTPLGGCRPGIGWVEIGGDMQKANRKPEVFGDAEALDKAWAALTDLATTAGWTRARSREARASESTPGADLRAFVSGDRCVILVRDSAGGKPQLKTLGAWPHPQGGGLDVDEHNSLIDRFENEVLAPAAERAGALLSSNKVDQGLDDWTDPRTVKALRQFACGDTTNNAHPSDRRRWNDFIISASRSSDPHGLHSGNLVPWLEGEGFAPELAARLAQEYENGISLLKRLSEREHGED